MKHSGIGIASFVISILSGLSLFAGFTFAGMAQVSEPGSLDEASTQTVIIGLAIIFFFITSLVAFGLGLGGLFQQQRKKVFAILGLVISSVMILSTAALIAFGLSLS